MLKPHGTNYFEYEGHHCRRIRFGDVEQGFAEADHVFEWRYQSAPIEHAPTETTGCIVVPTGRRAPAIHSDTQAAFFTLDNTALILDVPVRQAAGHRRHRRRRLRRQGRRDRRADRLHRRDGHQPAGQVRLQPRGGDAGLLAARGRADLHQGRRDERRADRRPPGHALRRRRRLLAPQPVRRDQGRGAHARARTRSRTSTSTPTASTPTARRRARCAASASRSPTSRSSPRWTGSRARWSLDPLEFRLKNAYRDGDMKAHRKIASGTALIEVIQRAAELVGHDLRRRVPDDVVLGGALMAILQRARLRVRELPDGHEPRRRPHPGARARDDHRQLRGHAVLGRPRPGPQDRRGADRGRDARAALREHHRRHGRHRHGPALHGHVRLARHPPRRQRRDHGRPGGARGDALRRRRGARGRRRGPRDRRHGLHQAQGLRREEDPRRRPRAGRALQARPHDRGARDLPQGALLPGPGDGRDGPGLLPGARLHGGRRRGRRRDRRGRGARAAQRLRGRPRDQPRDGHPADRGRRLDGHLARPVRDDRAVLPVARARPARLRGVPDARARGQRRDGDRDPRVPRRQRPVRRQGHRRDDRQRADPARSPTPSTTPAACGSTEMPFTPERVLRGLDELHAPS